MQMYILKTTIHFVRVQLGTLSCLPMRACIRGHIILHKTKLQNHAILYTPLGAEKEI